MPVRVFRCGVPLDPAGIVMQVVHTDLRPTGTFACGDEDLNRLWDEATLDAPRRSAELERAREIRPAAL